MLEKIKVLKNFFKGGVVVGKVPSTFIGENVILDVNSMTGAESVRIDGTVKGNINIEDECTIGQSGTVIGNISANSVIVAGRIVGDIISEGTVHLTSTAKVVGNIDAINIIVDEGAKLKGKYQIGDLEKDFEFNPRARFRAQEI